MRMRILSGEPSRSAGWAQSRRISALTHARATVARPGSICPLESTPTQTQPCNPIRMKTCKTRRNSRKTRYFKSRICNTYAHRLPNPFGMNRCTKHRGWGPGLWKTSASEEDTESRGAERPRDLSPADCQPPASFQFPISSFGGGFLPTVNCGLPTPLRVSAFRRSDLSTLRPCGLRPVGIPWQPREPLIQSFPAVAAPAKPLGTSRVALCPPHRPRSSPQAAVPSDQYHEPSRG